MATKSSIRIRDRTGVLRSYVVMRSLDENGVDYAILSPEDEDEDLEAYVAFGFEVEDGERYYYPLAPDISERLVQEYRDGCEVELAVLLAGDSLAVA